ncbi:MAG: chloride channel protein [Alkalibacterium sp.]|nr:chloride channel protein [Alkalibacterium sp.]
MKQLQFINLSKINYVLKGILVGAVAGAVVSVFRMAIYAVLNLMPSVYSFLKREFRIPGWIAGWVAAVLVFAFLVILIGRDDPDIQGNGVAELKGQLQGTLKLNWWSILWRKFTASTLVLGMGIPVGREGPSIQIGGVVGQGINRLFKGNKTQENILISSGAAAGLSAAFNAPMSGLVDYFSEEVHHRFSSILILTVFQHQVTANFLAFHIFGSKPASLIQAVWPEFPLEDHLYLVYS